MIGSGVLYGQFKSIVSEVSLQLKDTIKAIDILAYLSSFEL